MQTLVPNHIFIHVHPQNHTQHKIHTCIHGSDMQGTHTDIAHKCTQTQACTNSMRMHTSRCTCRTHIHVPIGTCAYTVTCMCKPRNTYKTYSHVSMHTVLHIHMCVITPHTLLCAHVQ